MKKNLTSLLPDFSVIDPKSMLSTVQSVLEEMREQLRVLESIPEPTFQSFVVPLEKQVTWSNFWSPISHLHSVCNTDELKQPYEDCLEVISDYFADYSQNTAIYEQFERVRARPDFAQLTALEQLIVNDAIKDFQHSGVHLPAAQKQEYKKLVAKLSKVKTDFENCLQSASDVWTYHTSDETVTLGLPDDLCAMGAAAGVEKHGAGYLFRLDDATLDKILTFSPDRALRERFYRASITKASELFDYPEHDNTSNIASIVNLKRQISLLLGFKNTVELILEDRAVKSLDELDTFYKRLIDLATPQATQWINDLKAFAKDRHGLEDVKPWDMRFLMETYQKHCFDFSEEELRPYFPLHAVQQGLFTVLEKLFAITLVPEQGISVWHSDVTVYTVHRAGHGLLGYLYLDLFPREQKRPGAWMDDFRPRCDFDGMQYKPVVLIAADATPPSPNQEALLSYSDVVTLFHEFGHALHGLCSQVQYPSYSGVHGVSWDTVEFPSQFLENWCRSREGLQLLGRHHQTGALIPDTLIDKCIASEKFGGAYGLLRQIRLGLFDLTLFRADHDWTGQGIIEAWQKLCAQFSFVPQIPEDRFPCQFGHIFGGGYSAGYYSYLWALQYAQDAFGKFNETEILSRGVGTSFFDHVLSQGGSEEMAVLFTRFRGRPVQPEYLIRYFGIEPK